MKMVVIYKSKTGFAKKYAEWIAEELSSDIFEVSKVNINMLTGYDTIIKPVDFTRKVNIVEIINYVAS